MKKLLLAGLVVSVISGYVAAGTLSVNLDLEPKDVMALQSVSINEWIEEFRALDPDQQSMLMDVVTKTYALFNASVTRLVSVVALSARMQADPEAANDEIKRLKYGTMLMRALLEVVEPICCYMEDLCCMCETSQVSDATKMLFRKFMMLVGAGAMPTRNVQDPQDYAFKMIDQARSRLELIMDRIGIAVA